MDSGESWSWTSLGVGTFSLVVDPLDPKTVLAATSNGLWKTSDGGATWVQDTTPGLYVRSLTRDPSNPATLYAGGSGLFRSTDGGRTWSRISYLDSPTVAIDGRSQTLYRGGRLSQSKDFGQTWSFVLDGFTYTDVRCIAVEDSDPPRIYAAGSGLTRSLDGGENWDVSFPFSYSRGANSVTVDPSRPGVAYVGTWKGVLKTIDRGQSWGATPSELIEKAVMSVAVSPSGSSIYAGTWHAGMFRSSNGGLSWQEVNSGFGTASISVLAIDPNNPRNVIAGGLDGIFRTEDGGASWSFSGEGLEDTGQIASLAFDADSTTVYASVQFLCPTGFPCIAGGAVFRSVDSGRTWKRASLGQGQIMTDPRSPGIVYVRVYDSSSFYRSSDFGMTWNRLLNLPFPIRFFSDPIDPSVFWESTDNGVYVSRDGGNSWRLFGFSGRRIPSIALDSADRLKMYVAIDPVQNSPGRVLRTSDGGQTWTQADAGLPDLNVTALVIDPITPSTLYAALGTPSTGSFSGTSGVFRTVDGGRHWQPFNFGNTRHFISGLAIDRSGRFLYASSYGGGVHAYEIRDPGRPPTRTVGPRQ